MNILDGLKVCFVAGTLGQGGAERQLFYQLQTLKKCGAQPVVFCFSKNGYWQERIEAIDIPVHTGEHMRSRVGRLVQMISRMRSRVPDVLQSTHFYANLYVVMAARSLHAFEIATVRSNGFKDVSQTGLIAGHLSLWLPRNLVVNSRSALANLRGLGRSSARTFYLPNVVDTERFVSRSRNYSSKRHLLMVGRLDAPKRFDTFLRLLSDLNQLDGLTVTGHIAGAGPQEDSLKALACQLGLGPEDVHFHGAVSDIEHLYQQADIALHLSDWEGLPNTILEAMSCGLPVIASAAGGIPELIQDGQTGFLVDPNDESSLLARVHQLVVDQELRIHLGCSARAFIEEHHALHNLPNILEHFYEGILR